MPANFCAQIARLKPLQTTSRVEGKFLADLESDPLLGSEDITQLVAEMILAGIPT